MATGLAVPTTAASAQELQPECLRPQVTDVMVSQGLPSYGLLTRGKSTLVRYFLATPSCAPAGTTMTITGGFLKMSTSPESIPLSASLPLPPAPPQSVGPLPGYNGDAQFVVPGDLLVSSATERFVVDFDATLNFSVATPGAEPTSGSLAVTQVNGKDVLRTVERPSNPLRVLVVPMGDPGNAAAAFPKQAKAALQNGMTSLARMLPIADRVMEMDVANPATTDVSPLGLRYSVNPGLLDISRFMSGGKFCGDEGYFSSIGADLLKIRNDYNRALADPELQLQEDKPVLKADVVLGVVWQGISRGPLTGELNSDSCIEGYAMLNGRASWIRIVDSKTTPKEQARPGVTGSLAGMEIVHNMGSLPATINGIPNPRYEGFHSKNTEADITAPNRAHNLLTGDHIADDRSVMRFTPGGWHDGSTLLEKEDWTQVQCLLTPSPLTGGGAGVPCKNPGSFGGQYGVAAQVQDAIYLSGSTDGTAGGTDLHSYVKPADADAPQEDSDYRLVQRDAQGQILSNTGFPVTFDVSGHSADGHSHGTSDKGSIATSLPAHPQMVRFQVYKGSPSTAAGVLLYERQRNGVPRAIGAGVSGNTVTVTVSDDFPEHLRLDVFLRCSTGPFPVIVDGRATSRLPGTNLVVFRLNYDSSRDCPLGQLVFQVSDGFTATVTAGNVVAPQAEPAASIYSPLQGTSQTLLDTVTLSGAGRDTDDKATGVQWRVAPPETTGAGPVVGEGESLVLTAPPGGFALGDHLVTLEALDDLGNVIATAKSTFTVLPDEDGDGSDDDRERLPCLPATAVTDPSSAWQDSDFDGLPDVSDPAPCASSTNVTVTFGAQTLNDGSSGLPVTMELSRAPFDLRKLRVSDLYISQVGYHYLDPSACSDAGASSCLLPAQHFDVRKNGTAIVQFDRQRLMSFITSKNLSGYVPIFVGARTHRLHGADPRFPTYSISK